MTIPYTYKARSNWFVGTGLRLLMPLIGTAVAVTGPVRAQASDTTLAQPAITATDVARRLEMLTADSLRHRGTSSAGLEKMARSLITEFQHLHLDPAPNTQDAWLQILAPGSWMQRYALPGQQHANATVSSLAFARRLRDKNDTRLVNERGDSVLPQVTTIKFATDAYFLPEVGPQAVALYSFGRVGAPMAAVAGRWATQSVRGLAEQLRDRVVLYVPPVGIDSTLQNQVVDALYAVARGVIIVSWEDSTHFAALAERARRQPVVIVDDYLASAGSSHQPWVVTVRVDALRKFLDPANIDIAQLRAESAPSVKLLPALLRTRLYLEAETDEAEDALTAPNVLGVIEGSDPALKSRYVIVSAPMDTPITSTADTGTASADRIQADAGGSSAGVAALLEVAKALRQPGVRLRRSVMFVATSGGRKGLWGTSYFVSSMIGDNNPFIAAVHLDLTGRPAGDSLWIDGLGDVEMTPPLAWIAQKRGESGIPAADGGTVIAPQASYFPFVRATIPSLSFRLSRHGDDRAGSQGGASPDLVAHAARLAFYAIQQISVADQPPRWSRDGRGRLSALLTEP